MFTLIHGNRQDVLAATLAQRLRDEPAALFAEEVVLVQSEAMARWLRLYLAEELGVAAQIRFPFPAGYIWELFGAVLPATPRESPLATERLHWRLLRLLGVAEQSQQKTVTPHPPGPLPGEGGDYLASQSDATGLWAPVIHYLNGGDLRRRDGLARQLAATFDRYLAFRPDWLEAWGQNRLLGLGMHEAWQAALWRELVAELDLPDLHPRDAFFQALAADPTLTQRLPARLQLFGIGNLPPAYLDIFRELGRYLDVRLYLLDPCAEYWGDVVASRDKARAALETPDQAVYLDVGHPLLGSFGRLTRQFLDRAVEQGAELEEAFVAPANTHLLGRLQHDLLTLSETVAPLAEDDKSIQVHICHGPRREVEVLHDQLLARFAADPGLRPGDVLVLTPDIETFAPLVEAVFGTRPAGRRIPYTIADRPPGRQAPLLQAFFALLDLAAGRLEAEPVIDFLSQSPVARRLQVDANDMERIRDWVREAGIRWGVDAAWRGAQDLPADADFTWRQGLDRLLLGIALGPEGGSQLFAGRLPPAEIPGGEANLLGRLISFADDLFAAHGQMNQPHDPARWAELLERWLLRFFDGERDPADLRAAQSLRRAWRTMADEAAAAGCTEAVPLAVIRRGLDEALQGFVPSHGFVGGGVTFAALRAWRAVPARVICLLGMNDGAYPRNPVMPGFDLTVTHPRAGDRTPRDEDRQALLDVLLCAQDGLLISYSGRGIRDNAPLPPASVVAEIFDTLVRSAGAEAVERLTTVHPLQAFSRRYFNGMEADLFSYEEDYAAASRAAAGRQNSPFGLTALRQAQDERLPRYPFGLSLSKPVLSLTKRPVLSQVEGLTSNGEDRPAASVFLPEPLPPAEDEREGEDITPEDLIAFLRNPARALLRDRLGIRLEESEGLLEDSEPFILDRRTGSKLDTALVQDVCAGADQATARALARARGSLPPGTVGEALFDKHWQSLESFARKVKEAEAEVRAAPAIPVSFDAHGLRVNGRLSKVGPGGLLAWRVGDARGPDLLDLWVRHLLLCHTAPQGIPPISRLLTPAGDVRLGPVENAGAILVDLLALYQRGQRELLPFLPRTAYAFVTGDSNWRASWQNERTWSESDDPWFDLAWREADPLGGEFDELALRVYRPVVEAMDMGTKNAQ